MLTCALPACCCCLRFLLLAFGQGHGRHADTEAYARQCVRAVTAAKAAQYFAAENGARQRPSPGRREQKQAAESGAALHGFIHALHHSALSFSLLCSYPAPQPPPDSPLKTWRCFAFLACSFLRVASLANEQTTTRVQPLKAPGPFRCIVFIREVESTKIEVAFSMRSTGSDAEHGLFATETYRVPRCRSRQ
jgi:hypothetical protein